MIRTGEGAALKVKKPAILKTREHPNMAEVAKLYRNAFPDRYENFIENVQIKMIDYFEEKEG